MPGGITIRIAVCGESAGWAGVRLSSGGDVGLVRNLETFAGMLVVDKWTGNANGRQAAFWRKLRERKYTAAFIDQDIVSMRGSGPFRIIHCAGCMRGTKCMRACGDGSRLSVAFANRKDGRGCGVEFGGRDSSRVVRRRVDELEKLVRTLIGRRRVVRELIEAFRVSPRRPFPGWREQA